MIYKNNISVNKNNNEHNTTPKHNTTTPQQQTNRKLQQQQQMQHKQQQQKQQIQRDQQNQRNQENFNEPRPEAPLSEENRLPLGKRNTAQGFAPLLPHPIMDSDKDPSLANFVLSGLEEQNLSVQASVSEIGLDVLLPNWKDYYMAHNDSKELLMGIPVYVGAYIRKKYIERNERNEKRPEEERETAIKISWVGGGRQLRRVRLRMEGIRNEDIPEDQLLIKLAGAGVDTKVLEDPKFIPFTDEHHEYYHMTVTVPRHLHHCQPIKIGAHYYNMTEITPPNLTRFIQADKDLYDQDINLLQLLRRMDEDMAETQTQGEPYVTRPYGGVCNTTSQIDEDPDTNNDHGTGFDIAATRTCGNTVQKKKAKKKVKKKKGNPKDHNEIVVEINSTDSEETPTVKNSTQQQKYRTPSPKTSLVAAQIPSTERIRCVRVCGLSTKNKLTMRKVLQRLGAPNLLTNVDDYYCGLEGANFFLHLPMVAAEIMVRKDRAITDGEDGAEIKIRYNETSAIPKNQRKRARFAIRQIHKSYPRDKVMDAIQQHSMELHQLISYVSYQDHRDHTYDFTFEILELDLGKVHTDIPVIFAHPDFGSVSLYIQVVHPNVDSIRLHFLEIYKPDNPARVEEMESQTDMKRKISNTVEDLGKREEISGAVKKPRTETQAPTPTPTPNPKADKLTPTLQGDEHHLTTPQAIDGMHNSTPEDIDLLVDLEYSSDDGSVSSIGEANRVIISKDKTENLYRSDISSDVPGSESECPQDHSDSSVDTKQPDTQESKLIEEAILNDEAEEEAANQQWGESPPIVVLAHTQVDRGILDLTNEEEEEQEKIQEPANVVALDTSGVGEEDVTIPSRGSNAANANDIANDNANANANNNANATDATAATSVNAPAVTVATAATAAVAKVTADAATIAVPVPPSDMPDIPGTPDMPDMQKHPLLLLQPDGKVVANACPPGATEDSIQSEPVSTAELESDSEANTISRQSEEDIPKPDGRVVQTQNNPGATDLSIRFQEELQHEVSDGFVTVAKVADDKNAGKDLLKTNGRIDQVQNNPGAMDSSTDLHEEAQYSKDGVSIQNETVSTAELESESEANAIRKQSEKDIPKPDGRVVQTQNNPGATDLSIRSQEELQHEVSDGFVTVAKVADDRSAVKDLLKPNGRADQVQNNPGAKGSSSDLQEKAQYNKADDTVPFVTVQAGMQLGKPVSVKPAANEVLKPDWKEERKSSLGAEDVPCESDKSMNNSNIKSYEAAVSIVEMMKDSEGTLPEIISHNVELQQHIQDQNESSNTNTMETSYDFENRTSDSGLQICLDTTISSPEKEFTPTPDDMHAQISNTTPFFCGPRSNKRSMRDTSSDSTIEDEHTSNNAKPSQKRQNKGKVENLASVDTVLEDMGVEETHKRVDEIDDLDSMDETQQRRAELHQGKDPMEKHRTWQDLTQSAMNKTKAFLTSKRSPMDLTKLQPWTQAWGVEQIQCGGYLFARGEYQARMVQENSEFIPAKNLLSIMEFWGWHLNTLLESRRLQPIPEAEALDFTASAIYTFLGSDPHLYRKWDICIKEPQPQVLKKLCQWSINGRKHNQAWKAARFVELFAKICGVTVNAAERDINTIFRNRNKCIKVQPDSAGPTWQVPIEVNSPSPQQYNQPESGQDSQPRQQSQTSTETTCSVSSSKSV